MSMRRGALLLCALISVLPCAAEAPSIAVDMEGYRPYGLCRGRLWSDKGFSGTVEIRGLLYDGGEVPLFRADLKGWTESLDFVFIPDERVRALQLVGGPSEKALPALQESPPASEAAGLFASLAPPFRSSIAAHTQGPPRIRARDPAEAAERAGAYFAPPRDARPRWLLAAYAALVLSLMGMGSRLGKVVRPGLIALSLLACLGTALLAPRLPVLYRLPLPNAQGPYDFPIQSKVESRPGYTLVSFEAAEPPGKENPAGGGNPSLIVLGVRTPAGHPIPLSAFPDTARLRFLSPPLVARDEYGEFSLWFRDFALGWGLYE